MAARFAAVTTDTGDFRPGHTDFSNYGAIGLCVAGAQLEATLALRTPAARAADTARWTAADTLPARVVALARSCGARFTLANTAPADLGDLFVLKLLARDDTGAAAVARARLARAETPAARRAVLRETLQGYLYGTRPAHVAAAESVAAEIDRQFAVEPLARATTYGALLAYADVTGNVGLMHRAAEHVLALLRPVPDSIAQVNAMARYDARAAYAYLVEVAVLMDDTAEVRRLVTEARATLGARLRASMFPPPPDVVMANGTDTIPAQLLPDEVYAYAGRKLVTPLRPSRWVAPEPRDTMLADPGRVTLLADVGGGCLPDVSGQNPCEELFRTLRRLHARYGTAGLRIVLQGRLRGYSSLRGLGVQPSAEEARDQWAYYHDDAGLPLAALALDSLPAHPLPPPDGRRRPELPPSTNLMVTLTGADGRVWYKKFLVTQALSPQFYLLLDRAIAARTGGVAPGAPAAVVPPTPTSSPTDSTR